MERLLNISVRHSSAVTGAQGSHHYIDTTAAEI
jgi:hypothetical protein